MQMSIGTAQLIILDGGTGLDCSPTAREAAQERVNRADNLPTGRGHAKVPALPLGCIHEPGGCRKRRLSNVGARTG